MRRLLLLPVLALIVAAPAAATGKPKPATMTGSLVARSATALSVKSGSKTLTCSLGDASPSVSAYNVGDKIKIACANGVLVAIARYGATPKSAPATAPSAQSAAGTIAALSATALTVHSDGGDLTCSLSSSSPDLGDYKVGDRVKVACVNGALVAIAHLDAPNPPDPSVRTESGTITALTDGSLTIQMQSGTLTCTLNDGSPKLGDFNVGDKVKLACTNGVLTAIAKVTAPPPPTSTHTGTGTISALSSTAVGFTTDGGTVTCSLNGSSPQLGDFKVGDHVKFGCANDVLVAIGKLDTTPPPPPPTTTGSGTVTALSSDSVTIHTDGGDVTCSIGPSSKLGDAQVGDNVKFGCINGVLYALVKATPPPPPTPKYTGGQGTIASLSADRITVTTDGGSVSCSLGPSSPTSSSFHVGDSVKIYCADGVLTALASVATTPPPPPTNVTNANGAISALSADSITVGTLTCSIGATSPSTADFHVGDSVRMYCVNGALYQLKKNS